MEKQLHPVHPGEVLLEEFLKPMELSENRLAAGMGVHTSHIHAIVAEEQRVTADTALRLAHFFGTSPQFWMGLQTDYELDVAQDTLGVRLQEEVHQFAFA